MSVFISDPFRGHNKLATRMRSMTWPFFIMAFHIGLGFKRWPGSVPVASRSRMWSRSTRRSLSRSGSSTAWNDLLPECDRERLLGLGLGRGASLFDQPCYDYVICVLIWFLFTGLTIELLAWHTLIGRPPLSW